METKDLWEKFYKENKYTMWAPGEATIRFFGRVSKEIYILGKDALDFGCGIGRNTLFMEELGLNTYGIDISENAILEAKKRRDVKKMYSWFRTYDGNIIPFADNFFDFVISHGVLDHILMSKAKEMMKEIHRVLSPNGLLEIEIHSIRDSRFGEGIGIEKNVFLIEDECEKGLPQHFFDEYELLELIEGFTIKSKYLVEEKDLTSHKTKRTSFWVLYLEKI